MAAQRTPDDVVNFAAGPAKLPREVIEEAQVAAMNWNSTGIGVMELSHRSKEFGQINQDCIDTIRRLLSVPDNYKILLLQGGGSGEFAAVPLNLTRSKEETADYFVTGIWSAKAAKEAAKYVNVNLVLPKSDQYNGIAPQSTWKLTSNASYVYYCDNETVNGVEFQNIPAVNDGAVIVCDMSSNILTRSIDVSKFGLIYAGAQKNVGCAGVTIVIVRDDLIGKPRQECPSIIDYTVQAGINSIFNTPATWSVYMLGLVLKWVERQGGVPAMENISAMKSKMLYDLISDSNGFYTSLVEAAYRSRVNVPFRIGPPDKREQLEEQFLTEAAACGLLQLKGHRSLGGIRASMYNAMSVEEVGKLVEFMKKFMKAQQN